MKNEKIVSGYGNLTNLITKSKHKTRFGLKYQNGELFLQITSKIDPKDIHGNFFYTFESKTKKGHLLIKSLYLENVRTIYTTKKDSFCYTFKALSEAVLSKKRGKYVKVEGYLTNFFFFGNKVVRYKRKNITYLGRDALTFKANSKAVLIKKLSNYATLEKKKPVCSLIETSKIIMDGHNEKNDIKLLDVLMLMLSIAVKRKIELTKILFKDKNGTILKRIYRPLFKHMNFYSFELIPTNDVYTRLSDFITKTFGKFSKLEEKLKMSIYYYLLSHEKNDFYHKYLYLAIALESLVREIRHIKKIKINKFDERILIELKGLPYFRYYYKLFKKQVDELIKRWSKPYLKEETKEAIKSLTLNYQRKSYDISKYRFPKIRAKIAHGRLEELPKNLNIIDLNQLSHLYDNLLLKLLEYKDEYYDILLKNLKKIE